MPSVARVTKKSSKARHKNDFYPTKQEFADGHIKALSESSLLPIRQLSILDVGFGQGIYGNSIRKIFRLDYLYGIDIDDSFIENPKNYSMLYKNDFLKFGAIPNYFDLIVGNPPYYEIQKFFEHAISLIKPDGVVSFLVKASYLESAIRYEWFKKHRPYSIWQAVNRPVGNHAESYVIVNYKKEDWGQPTKFGWLLSNKKEYSFYE